VDTFDPSTLTDHDLRRLGALLLNAGYRTEALAEELGIEVSAELWADIVRSSLYYYDSLGTSTPAILGKLFLFCVPLPANIFNELPAPLPQVLLKYGLVEFDADKKFAVGKVSITETDGFYFLADRLFENQFGTISVTMPAVSSGICIPPNASSLELMKAIRRVPRGSTVLDVGCGSGFLSLPMAHSANSVTGIDSNGRAVKFARANASLNGVKAQIEHTTWESYGFPQRYDQIVFNTPSPSVAYDFISAGIPKLLAAGGRAQVLLICEVMAETGSIRKTIDRMSTIGSPFDFRIAVNDGSPFSLSREAIRSGKRPPRTLLIKQPSEWRAYVNSLRSRGVTEVTSTVIDITSQEGPFS
jgi:hypothetical protein